MLGYVLAALFFLIIGIWVIVSLASGVKNKPVEISDNSVLKIDLNLPIQERAEPNPFSEAEWLNGEPGNSLGLKDILQAISKAKKDARIKGIYLNIPYFPSGYGTLGEIRQALKDFKTSGKFIYAYAESYSKGGYFISSVADKVWLNPSGELLFNGMYSESIFMKKAFEKIGVKMNVFRGKENIYKSAVEPLMLDAMSEESKTQTRRYLDLIYADIIKEISESRKINKDSIYAIGDKMLIRNAYLAKNHHFIDDVMYEDQVFSEIRKKTGQTEKDKINWIILKKYIRAIANEDETYHKEKIAVIYAPGEIVSGRGNMDETGSERMLEGLRKAREDERVKAVVLRINSPGGSALASEVIWREVKLTAAKKPLVVSMGDVAASGGYYIAAPAKFIFAEPQTLTGSIGIFGAMPDISGLMKDKLGITSDGVKLGQYSDFGKLDRAMSPDEKYIIQTEIDRMYEVFLSRVAEGRKLSRDHVHQVARGRVWMAADAKENQLIDAIGGFDMAIAKAASLANLKNYSLLHLPKMEDPWENIMKILGEEARTRLLAPEIKELLPHLSLYAKIKNWHPIQARMPYDILIH